MSCTTQTIMPFDTAAARKFVLAGNATFTALSTKTGIHFTYRVKRASPEKNDPLSPWFVSVLTGPDNTADYEYLGLIRVPRHDPQARIAYEHGAKSRIRFDAPSATAAKWLFGLLLQERPTPHCTIHHEGRCGRCGRALTVPESIISGFGPECIQHV